MRAILLGVILGLGFSGCCSAHRSWCDGYGSCVTPGETGSCVDTCPTDGCSPTRCSPPGSPFQKRGLFSSSCLFSEAEDSCGGYAPCFQSAPICGGCSTCGEVFSSGMPVNGCSSCSSCSQGDTFQSHPMETTAPSVSSGTWCASCQQYHEAPPQSPAATSEVPPPGVPQPVQQPVAPPPPPAATPTSNAPAPTVEPTEASLRQLVPPQEWQPVAPRPLQLQPVYSPAAATIPVPATSQAAPATPAVQPVLWVPAAP